MQMLVLRFTFHCNFDAQMLVQVKFDSMQTEKFGTNLVNNSSLSGLKQTSWYDISFQKENVLQKELLKLKLNSQMKKSKQPQVEIAHLTV